MTSIPKKKIKPKSIKTKLDAGSTTFQSNVSDLRSNFPNIKLHLLDAKPVLFLSETSIATSTPVQDLTVLAYSP